MIVLYDKDGIVRHILNDDEYTGLLQVNEIPEGKYISRIDISDDGTQNVVFEDLPPSEVELLKARIESMELALAEALGGDL